MKFAKVMFLHVSVILYTGMGGFSRPIPTGEVGGSGYEGLQAQPGRVQTQAGGVYPSMH